MRASKLITISTVAALMGDMSLAIGQGGGTASSGVGERGHATSSERDQAMSARRGRVSERGKALTAERGVAMATRRGPATAGETQGQFRSRPETSGLGNAYGSTRSADIGLNAQQRMRLHDTLSARTDIPRAPSVRPGAIRVNALVPRGVRLAAVPEEVGRIYPQFRQDRVFIRGDKLVIVNPRTSRIVAVLRT
jgi:hypothetical protein